MAFLRLTWLYWGAWPEERNPTGFGLPRHTSQPGFKPLSVSVLHFLVRQTYGANSSVTVRRYGHSHWRSPHCDLYASTLVSQGIRAQGILLISECMECFLFVCLFFVMCSACRFPVLFAQIGICAIKCVFFRNKYQLEVAHDRVNTHRPSSGTLSTANGGRLQPNSGRLVKTFRSKDAPAPFRRFLDEVTVLLVGWVSADLSRRKEPLLSDANVK